MIRVFSEEGANCVINYYNDKEDSERFAQEIMDTYGNKAIAVQGDVSKEEDIIRLFDTAEEVFGQVDIWVNNAYNNNGTKGPIDTFDNSKFQYVEKLVVEACMISAREMVTRCKKKGIQGHIVNMSSKSAFLTSSPDHLCYIAVKSAVAGITRGLAYECAKDGIWVNAIIPGYAVNSRTDFNSERYKRTVQYIPSKRYATPEEIGNVVAFVCSEKACQMNGVLVDVTGGTMTGQM